MNSIKVIGAPLIDSAAIRQLENCIGAEDIGVLTADAHVGYGHPIGGAIAYKNKISLSGVGFDIACGNKAVRTNIKAKDLDVARLMDQVVHQISFGVGRINDEKVDHAVLDLIDKLEIKTSKSYKNKLTQLAKNQLGTVGSGNHFVDVFEDEEGFLWIGVHFGSRGFGHKITTGFISISKGKNFDEYAHPGGMDAPPILFDISSEVGQDYLRALEVAGQYAYAGRDWVVDKVLSLLDNPEVTHDVHNHHNFAWKEKHFGEDYYVVRKGCTPAFPGQQGFVGANMFDHSVILEGVDHEDAQHSLYSTVHGAGRVMSRREAAGKTKHKKDAFGNKTVEVVKQGKVNFKHTQETASRNGIELRGGGADESPECYKNLREVLDFHKDTVRILHRLRPIGVAMAGNDIYDPYRD